MTTQRATSPIAFPDKNGPVGLPPRHASQAVLHRMASEKLSVAQTKTPVARLRPIGACRCA